MDDQRIAMGPDLDSENDSGKRHQDQVIDLDLVLMEHTNEMTQALQCSRRERVVHPCTTSGATLDLRQVDQ